MEKKPKEKFIKVVECNCGRQFELWEIARADYRGAVRMQHVLRGRKEAEA